MKFSSRLLLCLAKFTSTLAQGIDYPYEFTFGGNPLAAHVSSADPSAHVWDDKVYVYTSSDGNLTQFGFGNGDDWTYAHMDGYHVLSTDDMITWTDHGEILNSNDVSWSPNGWQWAPCAARRNGEYFLYYPHKDFDGGWRVGVATADSPLGPFKDIGAPIAGLRAIDPMVFVDDDGEAYMYLNSAQVAKLKPNMIELAEEMRDIDYGPQSVKDDYLLHFEEGSYMHKYKGKYYYSYSNSNQAKPTAYYGIGDSPYGPFEWKGALAGRKFSAPDHHSIINFKESWYYFYHMDTPWEIKNEIAWYGFRRIACFEKMYYDGDAIEVVNPSYFHVNAGGGAYDSTEGTAYNWDHWYSQGNANTYRASVLGTVDSMLYQSDRSGVEFDYNLPLTNGLYNITMKFAENVFSSAGQRKFHVWVEDMLVIANLDIFAKAGGKHRAYEVNIFATVTDNVLSIAFQSVVNGASVSAISAVPMEGGHARLPVELVSSGASLSKATGGAEAPIAAPPVSAAPILTSPVAAPLVTAPLVAPANGITSFQLIAATTNAVVTLLLHGTIVNLQTLGLPAAKFNVNAVGSDVVQSVRFLETNREESVRPFAYCGDVGGDYNACPSLEAIGLHTVSVIPFSASGVALSTVSITFRIV